MIEMSAVLGNLGEFIGSIAVLATLIYLAVQVRQSKELLEKNEKIALSQVYQHRANLRSEFHRTVAENEELARLMATIDDWDQWSEVEKSRIRHQMTCMMVLVDNIRVQTDLGLIDSTWRDEGVLELYEIWEKTGVQISQRLQEWYAATQKS